MNHPTAPSPETPLSLNAEQCIFVAKNELPVSCPHPQMALWNAHPRVYLSLGPDEGSQVKCPYCGTEFVLRQ